MSAPHTKPSQPVGIHSESSHGIVRVAALLGAVPLLSERGIDARDVLLSLGLNPTTLDHADNRIHYRMGAQFVQRCAELTACAHFGLLVGQRANVQSLGALGQLMLTSPTLRSALSCLLLHLHLQTRGGVPTHRVEAGIATLGYALYLRDLEGSAQVNDLVMAFEYNILKSLCGTLWRPVEVTFAHAAPDDLRPYHQFFRTPLRFDVTRSEIRFDATWLGQARSGHEVAAHRLHQHELACQSMLAPDDCAERVRRALRTLVMSGRGSEAYVAELMSMSDRSLRRALAQQGTSFRVIADEVRFEVARQLLADTELSTTAIGTALNYGDASAFTRACRRWTNMPPATWRTRIRSAAGAALEPAPQPMLGLDL